MKRFKKGQLLTYRGVRGAYGEVEVKVRALDNTLENGLTAVIVTGWKVTTYPRGSYWLASPLWLSPRKN